MSARCPSSQLLNTSEKVTRMGESYGSNGIDRIGLPIHHFRQNAIHGLGPGVLWTDRGQAYSNCTVFPHVISIGATFNRDTIHAIGTGHQSDEARAYANVGRAGLDWFTPNMSDPTSANDPSPPLMLIPRYATTTLCPPSHGSPLFPLHCVDVDVCCVGGQSMCSETRAGAEDRRLLVRTPTCQGSSPTPS